MRVLYREQRHDCKRYLDVDIFPVYRQSTKGKRKRKAKPTSETQARYNHQCRVRKLERLVMTNFEPGEALFFNPSYCDACLPADDDAAKRSLQNFFKRLKRYRKRKGLPELKYIATTEKGTRSGRYHHHLIINCADMPISELENIWGQGFSFSSLVIFDDEGANGLATYFCKAKKKQLEQLEQEDSIGNAWSASRNIKPPKETKRDGRISKTEACELYRLGNDAAAEFEKLYPDYILSSARTIYNDINGGYYIAARLRRKPPKTRRAKK